MLPLHKHLEKAENQFKNLNEPMGELQPILTITALATSKDHQSPWSQSLL